MTERMGLSVDEARRLRSAYLEAQGTTLKGLMGDFQIDPADYLTYVHQLDYHALLHPDPELRQALISLPQTKYVFTNASAEHAHNVLAALRLTDVFQGVIDIVAMGYANKPEATAYAFALEFVGAPAEACLMADDRVANLLPAAALGMTTVLVGDGDSINVDISVDRLAHLPNALPQLLQGRPGPLDHHG